MKRRDFFKPLAAILGAWVAGIKLSPPPNALTGYYSPYLPLYVTDMGEMRREFGNTKPLYTYDVEFEFGEGAEERFIKGNYGNVVEHNQTRR